MPAPSRSPLPYYARSFASKASIAVSKAIGRDQRHRIGRFEARLPAGHQVPRLQKFFPLYDTYAGPVLTGLCATAQRPLLFDIGANVGDTTLLALDAVDGLEVIAVEGDPTFLGYLNANVAQVEDRVTVVPRFVSTGSQSDLTYATDGSTGGLVRTATPSAAGSFVTPAELLDNAVDHDLVVWKSDIDVLHGSWAAINESATAIWFEFDPFMDADGGMKIPELTELIAKSGRVAAIYDNTGVHMMTVEGPAVPDVLAGLTGWMAVPTVPGGTSYLDVWLVRQDHAHRTPDGWSFSG